MTAPIQEPTQDRVNQGLEFRTRQLFRRPGPPAPEGASLSMWPNSIQMMPAVFNNIGFDGTSPFFTRVIDSSYWSGYYYTGAGAMNNATALISTRIGPQYSEWGLMIAAERGPDCGILQFSWATQVEASPGDGFDVDGEGLIPDSSTPSFNTSFFTAGTSSLDLYNAVQTKDRFWPGTYAQFRLMGNPGDPLTANGVFSANDGVDHMDGGPGIWTLKIKVNGKNASSSDYRTPITDLRLVRCTADGFPTA